MIMSTKPKKSKKRKKPRKPHAKARKLLEAIGLFVSYYSGVESSVHDTLRHFTGITPTIAACIFSGTRIDGAIGYLKRIAEATKWADDHKKLLDHLALQLGEITQFRNDLLHYGTSGDTVDAAIITNKKYAHIESRIRTTKISAKILEDLLADLIVITIGLSALRGDLKIPPDMPELAKGFTKGLPNVAWRYKPERQGRQTQKPPGQLPKPQRQPRSSQG